MCELRLIEGLIANVAADLAQVANLFDHRDLGRGHVVGAAHREARGEDAISSHVLTQVGGVWDRDIAAKRGVECAPAGFGKNANDDVAVRPGVQALSGWISALRKEALIGLPVDHAHIGRARDVVRTQVAAEREWLLCERIARITEEREVSDVVPVTHQHAHPAERNSCSDVGNLGHDRVQVG